MKKLTRIGLLVIALLMSVNLAMAKYGTHEELFISADGQRIICSRSQYNYYQSLDGGESWEFLNDRFWMPYYDTGQVRNVVIVDEDMNTMYALTYAFGPVENGFADIFTKVMKTENGGVNWRVLNLDEQIERCMPDIMLTGDGCNVLLRTGSDVYLLNIEDDTIQHYSSGWETAMIVLNSEYSADNMYMIGMSNTTRGIMYASRDAGRTWTPKECDLLPNQVDCHVFDAASAENGSLYLLPLIHSVGGVEVGMYERNIIYKYDEIENEWELIELADVYSALRLFMIAEDKIMVAPYSWITNTKPLVVDVETNEVTEMVNIPEGARDIKAVSYRGDEITIKTSGARFFRSENGGETWEELPWDIGAYKSGLTVSENKLYIRDVKNDVYECYDFTSDEWSSFKAWEENGTEFSSIFMPTSSCDNMMYAMHLKHDSQDQTVRTEWKKSGNGGESWEEAGRVWNGHGCYAFCYDDDQYTTTLVRRVIDMENHELYITSNNGETWTVRESDSYIGEIEVYKDKVYYSNGRNVYMSPDYGESWEVLTDDESDYILEEALDMFVDPATDQLYASTSSTVYTYENEEWVDLEVEGQKYGVKAFVADGTTKLVKKSRAREIAWCELGTYEWQDIDLGIPADCNISAVKYDPWRDCIWVVATNGLYQVSTTDFSSTEAKEVKLIPYDCCLHEVYPNPFNAAATVRFDLAKSQQVRIGVYNVNGQLVTELVNGVKSAGQHELSFDGSELASGTYIVRMEAGRKVQCQRMTLVK